MSEFLDQFFESYILAKAARETPNWLKNKICTRYVGQLETVEQPERGTETGTCGEWISG